MSLNVIPKIKQLLMRKNKTVDQSFVNLPAGASSELEGIVDKITDRKLVSFTANIPDMDNVITLSILSAGNYCRKGDQLHVFVDRFIGDFLSHSCSLEGLRSNQIKEMTAGFIQARARIEEAKARSGMGEKAELKGIV